MPEFGRQLNFFFHFIPGSAQPDGRAAAFIGGLFQSGYLFPLLKVVEVISGAMLILGFFTPLILVVLMPITLNISHCDCRRNLPCRPKHFHDCHAHTPGQDLQ